MNILFLLFPCIWLITGGWVYIDASHWDFSAFQRTEFLMFTALWSVLGAIVAGIVTLLFLHLPAEVQNTLRAVAGYIDRMPAKQEYREDDDDQGLFTLRHIIAYKVIDPFGHRTEVAQARDEAQWRRTQALHE